MEDRNSGHRGQPDHFSHFISHADLKISASLRTEYIRIQVNFEPFERQEMHQMGPFLGIRCLHEADLQHKFSPSRHLPELLLPSPSSTPCCHLLQLFFPCIYIALSLLLSDLLYYCSVASTYV